MLGKIFQKAREHLNRSQNEIAKEAGLTHTTINNLENGNSNKPNWVYLQFLIRKGINPYYLIGESEEIEGQKIDGVTRAEYETLQQNFDDLEKNYQKLEDQYNLLERVLQLLQIEVDQEGNVRQKK